VFVAIVPLLLLIYVQAAERKKALELRSEAVRQRKEQLQQRLQQLQTLKVIVRVLCHTVDAFRKVCREILFAQGAVATPSTDKERDHLFDAIKKAENIEMSLERSKVKTVAAQELIQDVLGGQRTRLRSGSGTALGIPIDLNSKDGIIGGRTLSGTKPKGKVKRAAVRPSGHSASRKAKLPGDGTAPYEPSEDMLEVIDLDANSTGKQAAAGVLSARRLRACLVNNWVGVNVVCLWYL